MAHGIARGNTERVGNMIVPRFKKQGVSFFKDRNEIVPNSCLFKKAGVSHFKGRNKESYQ